MEIFYRTNKLRDNIENSSKLHKKYGKQNAIKITKRMSELSAAVTLNDMTFIPQAGLHNLAGNYKGKLGI